MVATVEIDSEAQAIEAYQTGRITHAQVGERLHLNRWQTDAFLKQAGVHRPGEAGEFADDLANLRNLDK